MPAYKQRCCDECGAEYTPRRCDQLFCSGECRKVFENRRMMRGAELYDLFCAMRYDREEAQKLGAWKEMCRLGQTWRAEDDAERNGRRSWRPLRAALQRLRDTGRIINGDQMQPMLAGRMSGARK